MPVARSGTLWRVITALLAIGAIALYAWRSDYRHGGSPVGLTLGIAGYLLILLLAFFGIRKRWYRSRFGTLEQWLQSHIYLGLLTLLLLTLHTGGRFNDLIAVVTYAITAIVVISGAAGAILYVSVPRMLTEVESELSAEEISDQLNQLGKTMARIASGKSVQFQKIHRSLVDDLRPGLLEGWRLLLTSATKRRDAGDLTALIALVPKTEQEDLRQELVVSRQRKELMIRLRYQQRYRNILQAWLYIHVPFTIALLVFAVFHIAAVFYYAKLQ